MPIHVYTCVRVYLYTCHIHAFIHVVQTLKLEHVQKKNSQWILLNSCLV